MVTGVGSLLKIFDPKFVIMLPEIEDRGQHVTK